MSRENLEEAERKSALYREFYDLFVELEKRSDVIEKEEIESISKDTGFSIDVIKNIFPVRKKLNPC